MSIELNPIADPTKIGGINANLELIEDELNNNVLRRQGASPGEANQMELDLDMNGNEIFNIAPPTTNKGVATKEYVDGEIDTAESGLQSQIDDLNALNTTVVSNTSISTASGTQTVADTLDRRIVQVDTLSDLKALSSASLVDGLGASITTTGRAGGFTWQDGDQSSTLVLSTVASESINATTDTVTATAHGLSTGDGVTVASSVNGLTADTVYWVISVDANNFQLAASYSDARDGVAFDLTGTTAFSVYKLLDPLEGVYVTLNGDRRGLNGAFIRLYENQNKGLNVKFFGAQGDGLTEDTAPIQYALNMASIWVPEGTYMIRATDGTTALGIQPPSNRIIDGDNWTFEAIANDQQLYAILLISSVSNVTVRNFKLKGDRGGHLDTVGEAGHGLFIKDSDNIVAENGECFDCWGDGAYIGGDSIYSQYITFRHVSCDNNRRQGLSVTKALDCTFFSCRFTNTNGTAPESGVDIEPNGADICERIKFFGCYATGNVGQGFFSIRSRDIEFLGCHAYGNTGKGFAFLDNYSSKIVGGTARNNAKQGIEINDTQGRNEFHQVDSVESIGNTIHGVSVLGIQDGRVEVSGGSFSKNTEKGVLVQNSRRVSVTGSDISENTQHGLYSNNNTICKFSDLQLSDNSVGSSEGFDQMVFVGADSNNQIHDNLFSEVSESPRYSIQLGSSTTGNWVKQNAIVSVINDLGTGNVVTGNETYS